MLNLSSQRFLKDVQLGSDQVQTCPQNHSHHVPFQKAAVALDVAYDHCCVGKGHNIQVQKVIEVS